MIVLTVGTMHRDFARVVNAVDAFAADADERCVMQLGLGTTRPSRAEWFDFRPREDMRALYREARVVVAHAGIGTVMEVLQESAPLIVVPRLKRYGEHNNDHQVDLARAVQQRGWGRYVEDSDGFSGTLASALSVPPPAHVGYAPASEPLIRAVRKSINSLTNTVPTKG